MVRKSGLTAAGIARSVFLVGSIGALSACTDSSITPAGLSTDDGSDGVSIELFSSAHAIRALDLDNIFAQVSVDGVLTRYDQSSDITFDLTVQNGETLNLTVEWYEIFGGRDLLLGSYSFNEVISANRQLEIEDDDYKTKVSDGPEFDSDNDGFSNLDERIRDSNPLDPNSTPANLPDVRVKRMPAAAAPPPINGQYEDVWANARFEDVAGNLLRVNNLMINQGALRPDGHDSSDELRWFAMHDATFLYLFVLGENSAVANPIRDSGDSAYRDDNLNIYLDGNNSKGQSYDGVDDRHLMIPLLTSNNDQSANGSVVVAGSNSAPLPAVSFMTCPTCSPELAWEVRIPLADYGISVDSPFGIDIQIDIDHDGGDRDAKWGWFHPSQSDTTWQNPSMMATAILESN